MAGKPESKMHMQTAFNTPSGAGFVGSISAMSTKLPCCSGETLLVQEKANVFGDKINEEERLPVWTKSPSESWNSYWKACSIAEL